MNYHIVLENKCLTRECTSASAFFLQLIDESTDPCDNFYTFSCGEYQSNSTLRTAQNIIDNIIQSYINSPINMNDSNVVKMQKKYYQSCMDLDSIELNSNERLKAVFDDLGGWPIFVRHWNETDFEWGKVVKKCTQYGLYYDWFLYIENEIVYNSSNGNLHVRYLNYESTYYSLINLLVD